jgi:hypothetical protein
MEPWQEMLSEQQRKILNAEEVRALLDYDPETGVLRWKQHMTPRARMGKEAGVIQQGKYRRVGIYGRYYMAHRLAWLIVTGEWPTHEIDHINGQKADNRLCNLRPATPEQNKRNTRHRNNTGLPGASYSSVNGKFRAQIRVNGRRKFLGWFDNAEDAHAAYVAAARRYHGEFAKC